jgi:cysteine desulfurase
MYLDYAATAPVRPEVAEVVRGLLLRGLGNPSSIHGAGREARQVVEEARRSVAALVNARPDEIIFTSGGTEANNLALRGVLGGERRRLLLSSVEHLSVLRTAQDLSGRGYEVEILPVDESGRLREEAFCAALRGSPALVSLALVNNETGHRLRLRWVAQQVRAAGGLLHLDAVQAAAHLALDVEGVDLLSLSAHKLGGLAGAGALFVRRGTKLAPQLTGGHQENEHRGGTENTVGWAAFGAAARLALAERSGGAERLGGLRDGLERGIRERIPGARWAGDPARRAPHISNVRFPGCDGQLLLIQLDLAGICASSGSACATGQLEPSHVLLAMGVPPEEARGALRFSLGYGTSEAEIERLLAILPEIVEDVRRG